jgi:hypothetical protein
MANRERRPVSLSPQQTFMNFALLFSMIAEDENHHGVVFTGL